MVESSVRHDIGILSNIVSVQNRAIDECVDETIATRNVVSNLYAKIDEQSSIVLELRETVRFLNMVCMMMGGFLLVTFLLWVFEVI